MCRIGGRLRSSHASDYGVDLEYHPLTFDVLTKITKRGLGQCLVGSLTGAVSSQRVTEEHEGLLMTVGHRQVSAMV